MTDSATPALEIHPVVKKHRVLLIDDHPIFRRGVAEFLGGTEEFEVTAQASTPGEALAIVREEEFDLVILDLSLPHSNGMMLLGELLRMQRDLSVLMLSMHDEQQFAIQALQAGAKGYLMKRESPEVVLEAARKLVAGETYVSKRVAQTLVYRAVRGADPKQSPLELLSPREVEILHLFGEGYTTTGVSARLNLSPKTVETHRLHMKEKLGIRTALELVRFATRLASVEGQRKPELSSAPFR